MGDTPKHCSACKQHLSIQGGTMGQMQGIGQLNQLGQQEMTNNGVSGIQQALQQHQKKQQMGSPVQTNPISLQQHLLTGQPSASLLPGQQMATTLSNQVCSPAPVQSPRPQSPHSSPSPRIQLSPHHAIPNRFSAP